MFLLKKWNGITKDEVFLSYDLLGAGELDQADEDDMGTMFRLLEETQARRAHIYVWKVSSSNRKGLVAGGLEGVCEFAESTDTG